MIKSPKRLLLLVLALMLIGIVPAQAATFFDTCAAASTTPSTAAGSDKDSATNLTATNANTCTGDAFFFADWYKLDFSAPASLGIYFSHSLSGTPILYNPQMKSVPATYAGTAPSWEIRAAAGVWYLMIPGGINQFGGTDYGFTYAHKQQDDCGGPGDAGNAPGTAQETFVDAKCQGRVWGSTATVPQPPVDPADWYKVSLTTGSVLELQFATTGDYTPGCGNIPGTLGLGFYSCENLSGILTVDILDPTGKTVLATGSASPAVPAVSPAPRIVATKDGQYRVRVTSTSDMLYEINVSNGLVPPVSAAADCGQLQDAGNTRQTAQGLPASYSCTATLGVPATDTDDWYSFSGNKDDQLRLHVGSDAFALGAAFSVYDPTGVQRAGPTSTGLYLGQLGILNLNTLALDNFALTSTGTWTIQVHMTSGTGGHYQLTIDVRGSLLTVPTIDPTAIPSVGPLPTIGVPGLEGDFCAGNVDAGNSPGTASRQNPSDYNPVACYGNVGVSPDSQDWYSFEASVGQRFTFLVGSDGLLDPTVTLYKPGKTATTTGAVAQTSANQAPYPEQNGAGYPIEANGLWRIKIAPASSGNSGYYSMTLDLRPDMIGNLGSIPSIPAVPSIPGVPSIGVPNVTGTDDNCGGTGDANTTGTAPRQINTETACYGYLGAKDAAGKIDSADWYHFDGVKGADIVIAVPGDGQLDPTLTLYTPKVAKKVKARSFPQTGPIPDYLRYTLPSSGKWRIQITRASGGASQGRYALFLSQPDGSVGGVTLPGAPGFTVPSLSGDCNQSGDASNSRTTARQIQPTAACRGDLGKADSYDWYRFQATAEQKLSMFLTSADYSLDADLYLYDSLGRLRASSANGGVRPETFDKYRLPTSGTWYVLVKRDGGAGEYYMGFSLEN